MKVKDLARILNGVPGDFQIQVTGLNIHFAQKFVGIRTIPEEQPPVRDRFFPNTVGMDDDNADYRTNTTPRIDLSNPPETKTRFTPNEAGWTKENEFYYQKWKNGGNDLTYLEELEEIDKLEKNDDYGSNTINTHE